MSHAIGKVIKDEKVVAYFWYDGTVDFALSRLYWNESELFPNRHDRSNVKCTCGGDEPVILYADYGKGFHWAARACLKCRAITRNFEPFVRGVITYDGMPDVKE